MPIYTCTTTASSLSIGAKTALAGEIASIHSSINHVPSTYVNVVFHELPADNVYTDGVPGASHWVGARRPPRGRNHPVLRPKSPPP
jgi:phenylpyruvate tautomerase PptA (4-oxalocrotonate tautomerase family)